MWRDQYFQLETEINLPIRFYYNGECSDVFLKQWNKHIDKCSNEETNDWDEYTVTYTENTSAPKLKVIVEVILYHDIAAADWKIHMENIGSDNTGMIEQISSMALKFNKPLLNGSFLLHKMLGSLYSPDDFKQSNVLLRTGSTEILETEGGRSSNKDSPYFTLDTGEGRMVAAIGWTGQWHCSFVYNESLELLGGIEDSHFILYPGERISLPSIVAVFCDDDIDKAYSYFRRLLVKHYIPQLPGRDKKPYLFCNTCFTRGGGTWLNECNEENQISLIRALKLLGVECVITDAGWFIGGWPLGAGNWDPDPEKYPGGMEPVSMAAQEYNMKYGLWFELERVMAGTQFALNHPELMLHNTIEEVNDPEHETLLADLGKAAAIDYIYAIVERFFKLKNFTCYRQDFNLNPLNFWRSNDTPDRIGITEIKYINGLYVYLDRIRANYPELFMDGCASGGKRMDIEMIKRFHTHQKTDYVFSNTVDQNSLFALAHYLPNSSFTAHINRYDDYTFHSVCDATLCLGWTADSETETFGNDIPFSLERAKSLIGRYQQVQPFLNADFYPLTAPDHSEQALIACEYIDGKAHKGVLFIYKREENTENELTIQLKAIDSDANYFFTELTNNISETVSGEKALNGYKIKLKNTPDSKIIYFEKK